MGNMEKIKHKRCQKTKQQYPYTQLYTNAVAHFSPAYTHTQTRTLLHTRRNKHAFEHTHIHTYIYTQALTQNCALTQTQAQATHALRTNACSTDNHRNSHTDRRASTNPLKSHKHASSRTYTFAT